MLVFLSHTASHFLFVSFSASSGVSWLNPFSYLLSWLDLLFFAPNSPQHPLSPLSLNYSLTLHHFTSFSLLFLLSVHPLPNSSLAFSTPLASLTLYSSLSFKPSLCLFSYHPLQFLFSPCSSSSKSPPPPSPTIPPCLQPISSWLTNELVTPSFPLHLDRCTSPQNLMLMPLIFIKN